MLSIIIPTYNEADSLPLLCEQLAATLQPDTYELLVIDDDSPDQTWRIAEELKAQYPLRVLRRENTRGLSSAVVDGFRLAEGELIAVIDADLSHPPELLPSLLEQMKDNIDLVIASRLVDGGGVDHWPWYRRLLSWGGRMLARPLTEVKDIMSGYFLVRREVIQNATLVPRGYKILLEILVKGNIGQLVEVPYRFKSRELGASKMTLETHLSYLRQLAHLYRVKFGSLPDHPVT